MKMMSITMLLYLNGARFSIPAVIQSPFGTAATPGVGWRVKVWKSRSYLHSSSRNRDEITSECDLFWQFSDRGMVNSIISYAWVSRRDSPSKASKHTNILRRWRMRTSIDPSSAPDSQDCSWYRTNTMKIAVYTGIGHNSQKKGLFTPSERLELLQRVTSDIQNVEVKTFSGLAVNFVQQCGASVTIRGVRPMTDIAGEFTMMMAIRSCFELAD